jgi:hypothetical protein
MDANISRRRRKSTDVVERGSGFLRTPLKSHSSIKPSYQDMATLSRKRTICETNSAYHPIGDSISDDSGGLDGQSGLRRRRVAKDTHQDVVVGASVATTDSISNASASLTKGSSTLPAAASKSVVPLSMQLLRPFWSISCCPDCRHTSSASKEDFGNGHSNATVAPTMLDSRLRSVSTASLTTFSDTPRARTSSSADSTIQGMKLRNDSTMSTSSVSSDATSEEQFSNSVAITPTASSTNTNSNVTIEQIIAEYTTACRVYGCSDRINPGVLTTFRYCLPTLRVSSSFFDADMLALVEVLLKHCNGALSFITRLDFSVAAKEGKSTAYGGGGGTGKKGFRSHGAYALSKVLQVSQFIEEVYLTDNRIGSYGATSLFKALKKNTTVKTLLMKGCRIGEKGAMVFASEICGDDSASCLKMVDLSINHIGFRGCFEIEKSLKEWNDHADVYECDNDASPLIVDLEANLVFQEVRVSFTIL